CEQLTEAVHRHGAMIFAQLHHAGATSKPALSGRVPLAPSDVPAAPGAPVPKPMTSEEITAAIRKFTEAAVRCKKAGYDGVELHGAHSYLIGQFFSLYYNKRTDAYGGSLENRMRFVDEIIEGIRAALGEGFPISVRICGDEMTPDVPGTLTLSDGLEIGTHLEGRGIDVLNVSNGSALNGNANCDPYSYKPGWKKHVARAFKERLSIPIIATNTIKDPAFAESLLAEGVCDFVALGRSLIADPGFVQLARAGREDEIRPCIGCMFCRERLLVHCNSVACAVNPRMGREYILPPETRNGGGRAVAVIGGGPGGMEAARVLATRGFSVTLYEKTDALGGALNIADKPPHKELITRLTHSMTRALEKLNVDVRLGVEATVELVRESSPLGIFVAAGVLPIIPDLPGIGSDGVYLAEDVITGHANPTGRVAVIGTGLTGLETADMLVGRGVKVILVEMLPEVGPGLFAVIKNDTMSRIRKGEPEILTGRKLLGIRGKIGAFDLDLGGEDGTTYTVPANHVILALGTKPDSRTVEMFEREFGAERVFAIGGASRPGRIYEAVMDGYDRALVFDPE
ncbi:MAG: NAD(P)/FAD-dependent oxidoreductase, partial [Synergistaceae bacterium]|nr:NAD(P)/FAD-dependent oxidoreductase [Synergistaceae bacterium]